MAKTLELHHFERAAADLAAHGDNDTLPFEADTRFLADRGKELAKLAFAFSQELDAEGPTSCSKTLRGLRVYSERLVAPSGPSGFRVTTKIHPFWGLYLNGLGVAVLECLEPARSARAHSYRHHPTGGHELFDRTRSWRAFKEATIHQALDGSSSLVVQTDISAFYERVSHHYIENLVRDVTGHAHIGSQVVALLGKFSAGRSFGLPVGGQCARVLAELLLNEVDRSAAALAIDFHRFVDDYVLMAPSPDGAYAALAGLAKALGDYGLSLNRSKTVVLSAKHYADYVRTQLGLDEAEAGTLREIDLVFDPYTDSAESDYESLKETVQSLEVRKLLNRELDKALPDSFLVSQVSRTLRLHDSHVALQLVQTLLGKGNLHAFRGSWSTIMRGVAALRGDLQFQMLAGSVDALLDDIPTHSGHLLMSDANRLHYLRTLRFQSTERRRAFVRKLFESSASEALRRACIEVWRAWGDRTMFNHVRNLWDQLSPEVQRTVWLAAGAFGDQGRHFRRQLRPNLEQAWRLGIERNSECSFAALYVDWCNEQNPAT